MSEQITIKKLTQELFDQFISLWYFDAPENDPGYNQALFDMSSYSYIFLVGDKTVAIFGIRILWAGVGECWMMGSPEVGTYKLPLIKQLRKLVDTFSGPLHRIQMFVNDTPMFHKWAKLLGFTFEGILRQHSIEGEDHAIYAKVWE